MVSSCEATADHSGVATEPATSASPLPQDLQVAVLDLLETCKENEIKVPEKLVSAFMGALSSSRRSKAAELLSFEARLLEDKEERKKAISDSPIVAEAKKINKMLQAKQWNASLKVKDGYFKYVKRIDKSQEERPAKDQIETVYNGTTIQGLCQKLLRTMKGDFSGKETVEYFPIKNVNLHFEHGKTYLILGPPRSGKSSLLKLIAGILPEDKAHTTGGTVYVNKVTPETKDFVWSNFVGYIDQIDRLHPCMTVSETFEFAWQCRSGGTHRTALHPAKGTHPEIDAQIEKMDNEKWLVNRVLEALGLARVSDTFVGDQETVRGVSGGEKKRVTLGEMSTGKFPVLCMDEISTGLDAATTYDICKLIGEVNALSQHIKIVTLLQPPPETFALFDDLVLLSKGQVIYSGPVEEVVPYFESLGYKLPDRMDVADWLQALPSKDGASFLELRDVDGTIESPKHLTSDEFHEKF